MDWFNNDRESSYQKEWYDQAQICMNGHLINSATKSDPGSNKDYCPTCGKKTICNCQNCGGEIQGDFHFDGFIDLETLPIPNYCKDCGAEFPWTKAKIEAAIELLKEDDKLTSEDVKIFEDNIIDALSEGPRTQLAGTRLGKIIKKTSAFIGDGIRDIVVDIVSETAKKMIWPS